MIRIMLFVIYNYCYKYYLNFYIKFSKYSTNPRIQRYQKPTSLIQSIPFRAHHNTLNPSFVPKTASIIKNLVSPHSCRFHLPIHIHNPAHLTRTYSSPKLPKKIQRLRFFFFFFFLSSETSLSAKLPPRLTTPRVLHPSTLKRERRRGILRSWKEARARWRPSNPSAARAGTI